ncbi:MAG: (d)CMP kinase [Candidatus Omnitrophica bacterium]|nr:(d)CMP kinase [Candidatus Omnitrophota bacterium]
MRAEIKRFISSGSRKDIRDNIVAIDGPAGSGKSTVAKLVAKRLGYLYIDTGAMYRALTLKALKKGFNFKDEKSLVALAVDSRIELKGQSDGSLKIFLDGKDVSKRIREPDVNANISALSKLKEVRKNMVTRQRALAKNGWAVLEGRDIGTVVFPKARYKFYLDAEFKERVNRRHEEFISQNKKISRIKVRADLLRRDRSDKSRKVAPLKKAVDATYLDTTNFSIDEVVEKIVLYIR